MQIEGGSPHTRFVQNFLYGNGIHRLLENQFHESRAQPLMCAPHPRVLLTKEPVVNPLYLRLSGHRPPLCSITSVCSRLWGILKVKLRIIRQKLFVQKGDTMSRIKLLGISAILLMTMAAAAQ